MPSRRMLITVVLVLVTISGLAWAAPPAKGARGNGPLPTLTTPQGRVFKLGALVTPPAVIARSRHLTAPRLRAVLPTSVDLTPQMPPIGDQAQQGSCTAWSTGYYYKSFQEGKEHGWNLADSTHQVSPAWTYNQINFGMDGGSYIFDAFALFCDKGAVSLAEMPYDDHDYTTWPTLNQYLDAMPWRAQSYGYFFYGQGVDDATLTAIKEHLAGGDPVVINFPVYDDFAVYAPDYLYDGPAVGAEMQGNHAVCVVGYDDSVGGKGGFKILNSWGTSWGDHGAFYMSYDFFRNYAWEAWSMVDRQGYTPQNWARIRLTHTYRGDLSIWMGSGTPSSAPWSIPVSLNQGGSADDLDCYVDITDVGSALGRWWVQVTDNWTGDTGTLEEFTVYRGAGGSLSSTEVPQAINDNSTVTATLRWVLEQYLLRVVTDRGTPLNVNNHAVVTYRRLGEELTAQVWDGNDVAIEADSPDAIAFSDTSSASDDTERWQRASVVALGTASVNTQAAQLLEQHYYNQLHKQFETVTAGAPALGPGNFVNVRYESLGAAQTLKTYDSRGTDGQVWADRGSRYVYDWKSSASAATERWVSQTPSPRGTVTDAAAVAANYWHQAWAALTLTGTNATYSVSLLDHTLFGVPLAEPQTGLYGRWSGWCDVDTALSLSSRTLGNPGRATSDPVSWTISEPLTATANYITSFVLAGIITDADGNPLAGVPVSLTSADGATTAANPQVITDAAGRYEFSDLGKGTYVVRPSQPDWYFTPTSHTVTCTATTGNPPLETMGFRGLVVPRVVIYRPTGTGVALLPTVRMGFDRPMDQPATEQAFSLREVRVGGGVGAAYSGSFVWQGTAVGDLVAFTPDSRLKPNTLYQVTVTTGARSAQGAPLDGRLQWTFQTTDGLGLVNYAPRSQSAPLTAGIYLEFDRDVLPATLEENFTITPAVAGTFTWDGARRVRFQPSASLALNTTYQVTLGWATEGTDGSLLSQDFVWSFTTEGPVQLTAKSPDAGATGVPLATPLVLTFSRAMDRAATAAALTLTRVANGEAVAGVFSWDAASQVLTFRPRNRLIKLSSYRVDLAATARGANGAPVEGGAQSWTFRTADELQITSYTPTGRTVSTGSSIVLTFDRDVDPATFGLAINPVLTGTTVWTGSRQVTFIPDGPLTLDTDYTVTVAGTTAATTGLTLGSDFRWTFRTGTFTQVLSSTPRGVGISPLAPVQIVFDRAMNRTSVQSLFEMWQEGPTPQRLTGTFAWSNGNTVLKFTPNVRYNSLMDYRVLVPKAATSALGITLADKLEWVFQTGEFLQVTRATPQGDGEPTQAIVSVTFDHEVNRRSVERGFSLTPAVPGTFNWTDDFTFYFVPSVLLTPGTQYQVKLSAATLARNGLTLGSPYVWTFTVSPLAPTALTMAGVSAASTGSGTVAISYTLSSPAQVTAEVLNLAGRSVAVVQSSGVAAAGANTLLWSGRSSYGTRVPAGAYLVRVTARNGAGAQCSNLSSLLIR